MTVRVEIYSSGKNDWILEVVDENNNSIDDANGFAETFSAGAGLKASFQGFTGQFDVSWAKQSNLNDLVRFSILLSF